MWIVKFTKAHSTEPSENCQGSHPPDITFIGNIENAKGKDQHHHCLSAHDAELRNHLAEENFRTGYACWVICGV